MFQKKKDAVYYQICKHSALDIEEVEIRSAWKAVFMEKDEHGRDLVFGNHHTYLCMYQAPSQVDWAHVTGLWPMRCEWKRCKSFVGLALKIVL